MIPSPSVQAALFKRLNAALEQHVDQIIYTMREAGLEPSAPSLRENISEQLFYAFSDELEGGDGIRFADLVNGPADKEDR